MEQQERRELIAALLGARQALYALLTRCWDAPLDETTLSLVASPDLEALCQIVDEGRSEGEESLDALRAKLASEVASAVLPRQRGLSIGVYRHRYARSSLGVGLCEP